MRKKRIAIISFLAVIFIAVFSCYFASGFDLTAWYTANADIMENNSVGGMVVRYITWGITKLLVLCTNACESLYDTAFGFIDFTTDSVINNWIIKFKPAFIALMAISLVWLGILLILQHEKKPQLVINICLCILCVCCSTLVFSELNSFTNSFKEGVQKTVSANKIAYSTVNNNIIDLIYLNDKVNGLDNVNWKKKKIYGSGIKDGTTFSNVDYGEVLNFKSSSYDYKGETSNILKNRLQINVVNGKHEKTTREVYSGFGWNSSDDADLLNEFYYRYKLDCLTTWLQLLALMIIYITMSYKCVRIAYELLIARLLAYLYSAELSGGEKIKKILVFIRDSYILLCVTVLCIKAYDMFNAMIASNTSGIAKGIFALLLAFCVIDGPNLVEKLLGMDAGLKSSTARILVVGRTAMGVMHAPKSAAKAASGVASGRVAEGGILGGIVGATMGKKQADGSRTGGLAGMMNHNTNTNEDVSSREKNDNTSNNSSTNRNTNTNNSMEQMQSSKNSNSDTADYNNNNNTPAGFMDDNKNQNRRSNHDFMDDNKNSNRNNSFNRFKNDENDGKRGKRIMAKTITTEAIESKTRVWAGFDVFDFFFVFGYVGISFALKAEVHELLQVPFMIFSGLIAIFLTLQSTFNKKRRNYESLYFLITKDVSCYLPFISKEKGKENIK